MEILVCVNIVVTIINSIILIALAGTTAKMLNYFVEREVPEEPDGNLVDLPRRPSYADLVVSPNYDGFQPRQPNSDGAYGLMEED